MLAMSNKRVCGARISGGKYWVNIRILIILPLHDINGATRPAFREPTYLKTQKSFLHCDIHFRYHGQSETLTPAASFS